MSSLGSQWRMIRHYLSLSNLHSEVEKLIQKIKPASPEQWDNLINKFEKVVSDQVVASKEVTVERLHAGTSTVSKPTSETDIKVTDSELKDEKQKAAAPVAESMTMENLWQGLKLKKDVQLGKITAPSWKSGREAVSKPTIASRTAYVVSAIGAARSVESALRRTERLVEHLYEYPEARDYAIKEGAVRALLGVRRVAPRDAPLAQDIQGAADEALALVGYCGPPKWAGANVLALDGGGIRGLIAIEILRALEKLTGRRVHELFDLVVGVSTGAIIAAVVAGGGQSGASLAEAQRLYIALSRDMFGGTSRLGGASRLVWTHSYYDTGAWEKMLQDHLRDCTLAHCSRHDMPKLAIVSCVVNAGSRLSPFLFRGYRAGYRVRSVFPGTARARLWQAVRASAAAPTYFAEFRLGGLLHQDGGIVVNNPAGVGVHEARLVFGADELSRGCVISLGTGRALSPHADYRLLSRLDGGGAAPEPPATSWRDKFNKILDSATDTEGVHLLLNDLLPADNYFRFNPPLMEQCAMDEIDEAKIERLLTDTAAYIRRNHHKLERAAAQLTRPRALSRRLADALSARAHRAGSL